MDIHIYIRSIATVIEYIGITIVGISSLVAAFRVLHAKFNIDDIRKRFAHKIMLGLEFIIAAEIILVTVISSQEDLIKLGAVTVIRVLLGYALKKEVTE